MAKKRGLGRGLDALLGTSTSAATDTEDGYRELPLAALRSGPHQPREYFDEAALDALAESIRSQGVVEPVIVRPAGDGYEIVAGERRWRAAQRAGLERIPAVVRRLDARAAMAIALVENIQRADLNPLEEAQGLKRLIVECALTHEQAAAAVGRSRAAVSNILRLLELPADVQALLRDGRLGLGHAKVLLGAAAERQPQLAQKVVALGLSVRQTEALVKRGNVASASASLQPAASDYSGYAATLQASLGSAVHIQTGKQGAGRIVISFTDRATLVGLVERFSH